MTATTSRTFRIFVSSTFIDLQAERAALQDRVFPALRERCLARGARLQIVDLRWGISDAAGRDQQTMEICLSEVDRCRETSPAAFFVGLLGDRYGWRPLPAAIDAADLERAERRLRAADRALLAQWYRLDENAVPPLRLLSQQAREGVSSSDWAVAEPRLAAVLRAAFGPRSERTRVHTASATEQEIGRALGATRGVFYFFRSIADPPSDGRARLYRDLDAQGRPDREAMARLAALKARIRCRPRALREYQAGWRDGAPTLDHLDALCQDVEQLLWRAISAELDRQDRRSAAERESALHRRFAAVRSADFAGRAAPLRAVASWLRRPSDHPLVLTGAAGSGKTTLMARAATRVARRRATVIRFIGITPDTANGRLLLTGLCLEIGERLGVRVGELPDDHNGLSRRFGELLGRASAKEPLVLFIDALDQLRDRRARSLDWLPSRLPPHVHLVVSTLAGECLDTLRVRLPAAAFLELAPMATAEGQALLELWLADARRTLRPDQRSDVLDAFAREGLPLQLRLAFQEARRWRSFDSLPSGADGVPGLPGDVPGVLRDLFWRLSLEVHHGPLLVSRSLGYLAAARDGLSEDELVDVLSRDAEVMRDFRKRSPASPRTDRLPDIIWSRLYADLAPYLSRRAADGAETLGFYHRQVAEVVAADFLSGADAPARHAQLAGYFEAQPLERRAGENRSWNRRKLVELPHQQARSSIEALERTLGSFAFLEAKVTALGPYPLIADLEPAERLQPLRDALRLGAHALAQRPAELASQLAARLAGEHTALRDQLLGGSPMTGPRLEPYAAALTRSGGPLRETFTEGMVIANDVLASPDGRLAICGDDSNRLWIFDLEAGTLRHQLDLPRKEWLTAAAMHPIRPLAGFGAETGRIWWIDLAAGALVETRKSDPSETVGLAFVDGGRKLLAAHKSGALVMHDTPPSKAICRLDAGTELTALAVRDRWYLGTGSNVRVWDPVVGVEVLELSGQGDAVSALAVSADGRTLAVGYDDGNVELIATDGTSPGRLLAGHRQQPTRNNVTGLVFTRDDARLVSVAWDEVGRVWDCQSGAETGTLRGHSMAIYGLALVPGTDLALTSSKDSTLRVWDLSRASRSESGLRHHAAVDALSIAGGTLISGSRDRILCVWNLATGGAARNWTAAEGQEPHEGWITAVGLDLARALVHSAGQDGALRTWRLTNGAAAGVVRGDWERAAVAISVAASALLVVDSDDTGRALAVWPFGRGKKRPVRPKVFGSSIGLARNGRTAVVCDLDGGFVVVDVVRRKVVWERSRPMTRSRRYFTTAAVTDAGDVALLGGRGGQLEAWDLTTRKLRWTSGAHSDDLGTVAVSPDGRLGCSGGWDRLLQVIDLQDGRQIASFTSDDSWSAAAFADDNRTIVAADVRGAVHFLRLGGVDPGRAEWA